MKSKRMIAVLGLLFIILTLLSILVVAVYAQGPDTGEEVGTGEVEEAGIADPPGAGQTVLYMFVGAADSQNSATNYIATSIHCANYGSTNAIIEVQIIDRDGNWGPVMTGTETILPNMIATFSTQDTDVYDENTPYGGVLVNPSVSDDIDQGSGRILADTSGSTSVICTVQVLDPIGQPSFMTKLTLYDGSGNIVGGVPKVYLPLILKNLIPT